MNWDEQTKRAFASLLAYQRESERFLRNQVSKIQFDAARNEMLQALSDPTISARIQQVITEGLRKEPEGRVRQVTAEEVESELRIANAFVLRRNKRKIGVIDVPAEVDENFLKTPEDFLETLRKNHNRISTAVAESRNIKPRALKKARKRKIGHAVVGFTFGTGCAIVNSYVMITMPPAATSYAVALTELIQAAKDITGESND